MPRPLPIPFPDETEAPTVTELRFPSSGVTVRGDFTLNEFATLTPDNLEFLRLYVRVRGNLKEVERVLGVSYPTVRARFDTLLRAIGYEPEPADPQSEVLERLERGEITPDEAARKLRR
ncbi:MAG: hypothetical protein JWQ08_255 [Deinococcus sp.]|jgi:hypothetical protein|uniref:DUF2089 domain-containing protein n=1 Tax=Deinococcus puniceus TaxID=1182568 RepID=A0A172T625_9DEIO|nr:MULTISPECIES: DUF2089 domain-containing protein [Deinococcus]ANE42430.1 hypothetical protein SU48_00135 [Deinococcus puniceus]MDB5044205.1 hypothetical protein [Deinococcus sp.]THF71185.1 DUF2089 domain-containing protein [Deinococcus sp. Arct2-2]